MNGITNLKGEAADITMAVHFRESPREKLGVYESNLQKNTIPNQRSCSRTKWNYGLFRLTIIDQITDSSN